MDETPHDTPSAPPRDVPVDWEALENAFENNAPEVHSYLQVVTGDVLRVVDGVADPQMHVRIASDPKYLRIEAVSSREQYRWMERYIPTVEEPKLRVRLEVAIDGKGAFRRFKDVLMAHGHERERWFAYRSERLKTFMEAWLQAHSIHSVPRVQWAAQKEGEEAPAEEPRSTPSTDADQRRARSLDGSRRRLRELADILGPRDLESVVAFAEYLKLRRNTRAFAHHPVAFPHRREDASDDSLDHAPDVDADLASNDQEPGSTSG